MGEMKLLGLKLHRFLCFLTGMWPSLGLAWMKIDTSEENFYQQGCQPPSFPSILGYCALNLPLVSSSGSLVAMRPDAESDMSLCCKSQ